MVLNFAKLVTQRPPLFSTIHGPKKQKTESENPMESCLESPSLSSHFTSMTWPLSAGDKVKGLEASKPCDHSEVKLKLDRLLRCEECSKMPFRKRGNKEETDVDRITSNSWSQSLWVCLECGQYFCGGMANLLPAGGHARSHAIITRHPLARLSDDPPFCWCSGCNLLIELGSSAIKDWGKVPQEKGGSLMSDSKNVYAVRGLINVSGRDCYFNVVLQNFLAMPTLREYVMSLDQPVGPITTELKKLFAKTSNPDGYHKDLADHVLLLDSIRHTAPQFVPFQDQDSQELLLSLLNGLCAEEEKFGGSFISCTFGGELCTVVSCEECGSTQSSTEPFQILSLPVRSADTPTKTSPKIKIKFSLLGGTDCWIVQRESTMKVLPAVECNDKEILSSPSESDESYVCSLQEKQNSCLLVEESFMPIASNEPVTMLYKAESTYEKHEALSQFSDCGPISQDKDSLERSIIWQVDNLHEEQAACSESCGESFCRDVSLSLCIKDFNSLSHSHNVSSLTVEDNNTSSRPTNLACNAEVKGSELDTLPVSDCRNNEAHFDASVVMLEEPEVNFDLRKGTKISDKRHMLLAAGNIGGTVKNETDHNYQSVPLYTCLSLLTKPEKFSWKCEACTLNNQSTEDAKSKMDAFEGCEEASMSHVDTNGLKADDSLHRSDMDSGVSTTSSDHKGKVKAEPATFSGTSIDKETSPKSSSSSDNSSEVDQAEKKCSKLLGGASQPEKAATRRTLISKAPRVLVLHLLLFALSESDGRPYKLKDQICFPETLELTPYMDPSSGNEQYSYQLVGVIEHTGELVSGHYITYVRGLKMQDSEIEDLKLPLDFQYDGLGEDIYDDKIDENPTLSWFLADDNNIVEVSISEVLDSRPYILLYERTTHDAKMQNSLSSTVSDNNGESEELLKVIELCKNLDDLPD